MSEKFWPSKKKEEPPKPAGPSFEELVAVLPPDKQNELNNLKGIVEEFATGRDENGLEIDHSTLNEDEEEILQKYYALLQKAQNIFAQKKGEK